MKRAFLFLAVSCSRSGLVAFLFAAGWTAVAGSGENPTEAAQGRVFYCDPVRGSMQNDGSRERPWRTAEEVLAARLVQVVGVDGRVANPNALVKPGDKLLLRSGYHGEIRIASGYNDRFITIAAEEGHKPQVARVEIGQGRRWRIAGLTVSMSLAPGWSTKRPESLVRLGESGGESSAELVVEDCFIYTERDVSGWSAQDWISKAWSGIWLGRHGKGHAARNNYVLNTRFGINLCAPECVCEGNVVANFSADGIRVTRDGQIVQYNVVKNVYVSAGDGDANHDDGIQAFLFNKGRGTLRDVVVRGNWILNREDPNQRFPNAMQGIGFFDGPLINFLVEKNVVQTDHWHGISLYDAQGCQILDNACSSISKEVRSKPWIMLGQKQRLAKGNKVRGNMAHSFNFKADPEVEATDNVAVNEERFQRRKAELAEEIQRRFGKVHGTAGLPRVKAGD